MLESLDGKSHCTGECVKTCFGFCIGEVVAVVSIRKLWFIEQLKLAYSLLSCVG
jgi:hypothetical protein